jgi:hypothetical protein
MLVTALFLSLLSSTFALPSGAPICDLSSSELSGPHGKASTIANPLVVTVEKDLKASIKISGKFQGLLIWVDKEQFTKELAPGKYDHHGNFADLPDGFKYVDCNKAFPHSTVTHSGQENKEDTTLTWEPESVEGWFARYYKVHAIVMKDKTTWAKFVTSFKFSDTSSTNTSDSAPPKSGSDSYHGKKCHPKTKQDYY